MSEEMLLAIVNQKLESVGAEIAMLIKMNNVVKKEEPVMRTEAVQEEPEIKNVIVGTEAKPRAKYIKGVAETVDVSVPSASTTDVIDLLPIVFYEKKDVSFEQFILDCDLSKILNAKKYYTFSALLSIYKNYSGNDTAYKSLAGACGNRDYAFDVQLHQHDGKLVYGATDIVGIKNNIIDGKYIDLNKEKPAKKKTSRKHMTITDYLLKAVDVDVVRSKDWTLQDMANDYHKKCGKKISVLSIRNTFSRTGISGKNISGGYSYLKGDVLAGMIDAFRGKPSVSAVKPVEAEEKVVIAAPLPDEKSDGLTFSLADVFKSLGTVS